MSPRSRCHLSLLTSILLACLVGCLLFPRCSMAECPGPDMAAKKAIYWELYLLRMGKLLDCHFTFEMVWPKDDASVYSLHISDDGNIRSIDDLIENMSRDVPAMKFEKSTVNPRIVHVIDKDLIQREDYALPTRVTLKYSGGIDMLAEELQKQVPSIDRKRIGSWRTVFDDHTTKVTVEVKDQPIRRVLTECVPLENYHVFLWRAQTRISNDEAHTTLQYYGPVPRSESRK